MPAAVSVVKRVAPPQETVIVATELEVTADTVTLNVAKLDPAEIRTLTGVVAQVESSVIDTKAPPAGAGAVNITVQDDVPAAVKLPGLQLRLLNWAVATAVTETVAVRVTPLRVAVTVTVWVAETLPALMVKLALPAPVETVTDVGTPRAALLLLKLTIAPPDGAPAVSETVQVLDVPETREEAQLNPESWD